MNTKYILVGGYPHKAPDGGKAFCEELVKGFNEPIKILNCLFARPIENWSKSFEQDKEFFTRHLPEKKIEIKSATFDKFIEQIIWADVVYIRGGSSERLLIELLKNADFKNKLTGKTIAGSSAGANAISKYFYEPDSLKLEEGLGILSVKTIVHYRSNYNSPNIDWDKAYSEFDSYKEKLPIIALAEGQFKVFVK